LNQSIKRKGYTLHEFKHSAASLSMAAMMWEKLADGGVLVVIEPGTPDGFHTVRSIRTMLLQCCPPSETNKNEKDDGSFESFSPFAQEECHVIAPCTHNAPCPMERYASSSILHSWYDVIKEEDKEEAEWLGEDFDAESHPDWVEDDMSSSSSKQLALLDQPREGEVIRTDNLPEEDFGYSDNEDFTNMPKYMSNVTKAVQQKAFCSFVQGMHGADRKTEKFSYLVVQKRVPNSSNASSTKEQVENDSPFADVSLPDMIAQSINEQGRNESLLDRAMELEGEYMDSEVDDCGLELAQGSNLSSWGRIIRAPLKKKGHVYVDFCTGAGSKGRSGDQKGHEEGKLCDDNESTGRILRHRITKAASIKAPGIYHAARKARWGGLWPDLSERLHRDETNGKK
jgi:ribosomal protein RSM22 (predicted rRNA methylase)